MAHVIPQIEKRCNLDLEDYLLPCFHVSASYSPNATRRDLLQCATHCADLMKKAVAVEEGASLDVPSLATKLAGPPLRNKAATESPKCKRKVEPKADIKAEPKTMPKIPSKMEPRIEINSPVLIKTKPGIGPAAALGRSNRIIPSRAKQCARNPDLSRDTYRMLILPN
ncbi:hypothetical protein AC578_1117 [Pseudocercospora eumusae]|uniref:Uncharacterized protein n=1 Tax=Pseudocercospora eumusae TaxID=321146 RepID=A0A139GXD6_9PEZI|nr:hypothetical protein AC578_1117 [Pseudocercospora eumusae]